ncbi:UNVERIFIED_CONTAM: hypothetical protein K2H54_063069 [Gekko kuhli]
MWPPKRRNSSNLITCGAPADKVPTPPVSNDDSNKPSFLKALEAVVAAGRLGLLGPAAMEAVEAMPDLDAECRDGKVGQETPSSIPFLGEEEEGKEGEKEEEKEGKEEGKDGKEEEKEGKEEGKEGKEEGKEEGEEGKEEEKEERRGEEEQKAGKKERKNLGKKVVNKEGNTDVAVTPPVNGTESWRCTKKDIWICGDYVISLSMRRSRGKHLGLPASVAHVIWRGFRTMMWNDLLPNLHQLYHQCRVPSIIIIHLGENDLLVDSSHSLVTKMQNDLVILQEAFQDVVIIWSSLLPKGVWKPSEKSQVMESERNNVNCKMEEFCNENGMYYLSHPLLTPENKFLFTPDDTLSDNGAASFIMDMKKVLHTYLDHN